MNHEYISKTNLIDQYVLGKLAVEEIQEFEEHFVDCPECVEQINISRSFVGDLKGVAVERALFTGAEPAAPTWRWSLQQLMPLRLAAVIACGVVIVAALFAYFAVRRLSRLEGQLHQAKADASAINQKYQQGLDAAAESEKRHQETQQGLMQRLDELEKKLKTDEDNRDEGSNRGSGAPEVNFPIFALISAARTQGPARLEIALPATSSRFALSIPVEERRSFGEYRVTILRDGGAPVFNQGGFKPDAYHALSLSLNSNFLTPGNYDLRVEGLADSNNWTIVGSYPFRVVRKR